MSDAFKLMLKSIKEIIVSCEQMEKESPHDYKGTPLERLHDDLKAILDTYYKKKRERKPLGLE